MNAELVIQYRDDWQTRVARRRDKADELAALRMAGVGEQIPTTEDEANALMVPADEALVGYARSLPAVLAKGDELALPRLDTGITAEMVQVTFDLIDVVVQMLGHLAFWFPDKHSDGRSAAEYFSQFVSTRFIWHPALAEPGGVAPVEPSSAPRQRYLSYATWSAPWMRWLLPCCGGAKAPV